MAENAADAAANALAIGKDQSKFSCRMYEQKFPEVEDIVVVKVIKVAEMGAYVQLLEYNNVEGMILLSELSRRRIRSINKLIRVGRVEFVVVLRVDKEKGYIDLSKRRVDPEDIGRAEDKYNKSKSVHAIMRHIAETTGDSLESLYERFAWPLYRKYGHAYEAFKLCITNADKVFEEAGLTDISPELKEIILKNIRLRLTPHPIKLRADVEVSCFAYAGIDAIKEALHAGQATGNEDCPVVIKLLAPPLYVLWCQSLDKDTGLEILNNAVAKIGEVIETHKGTMVIKNGPRSVTEREDELLSSMMGKENGVDAGSGSESE